MPRLTLDEVPINPYRVIRDLMQTLDRARTIVIHDSALGGYKKHLPVATERYGTKFLSGNYARVADGLGGYSERIEKPQDVVPAIQRAKEVVESGRPALLEMITKEERKFSRF